MGDGSPCTAGLLDSERLRVTGLPSRGIADWPSNVSANITKDGCPTVKFQLFDDGQQSRVGWVSSSSKGIMKRHHDIAFR